MLKGLIEAESGEIEKMFEKPEVGAIKDLLKWWVGEHTKGKVIKGSVSQFIERATAELDKTLSEQVNAIMHHPAFLKLEGTWRGLKYLVDNTRTGQHVKLQVLNARKDELSTVLDRYAAEAGPAGWDQSPIFKKVHDAGFDQPGAAPYGCLVGDYQFDNSDQDVDLLKRMARICSAAHVPFVTAAGPKVMGLKSWEQLPDPASLASKMSTPDFANWRSFRDSEDARYVALALPRFLARAPYEARKAPEGSFAFEEDLRPAATEGEAANSTHDNYVWANSAFALAANINRAFYETGFCVAIRGVEAGGKVENLPVHTFPTDGGGIAAKCPTEISITQRREAELSRLGFMPLIHWKDTNYAAFVGGQTAQKPAEYPTSQDATDNAALSAGLPYVFLVSRFSHYLKKMIYDWVGSPMSKEQLTKELNDFMKVYVSAPMANNEAKAKAPFREVRIDVEEIPGKPGYYQSKAYLVPHILLEGVTVDLGVVKQVPSGKKG